MEKASILLRVSTIEQEEKQQEPECREFAGVHDWEVFKVYNEKGSAYKKEFSEREVIQEILKDAKENGVKHLIVWKMDRYSRLPPEKVIAFTKQISHEYDLQIHAVNGDNWSSLVESISKIKTLGFMGETLSNFLEELLKGFEHHRAYMESKDKSDRVKLKVVKQEGKPTKSVYGKRWGKPRKKSYKKVLELYSKQPHMGVAEMGRQLKMNKGLVHYVLRKYAGRENTNESYKEE